MELVHAEYSYKNRNDIIDDDGVVLPAATAADDDEDHALCSMQSCYMLFSNANIDART